METDVVIGLIVSFGFYLVHKMLADVRDSLKKIVEILDYGHEDEGEENYGHEEVEDAEDEENGRDG